MVVEDLYFNAPSLVNGKIDSNGNYTGTSFFRNMDQYIKIGDQTYLDNVLKEVLENSNKSEGQLLIGLSNRRLKEAAILSGDAEIKLPDSEVRELFNANKEKFDVRIDGKSAEEYFDNQIKANGLSIDTSLFFDDSKFFTSESDPRIMLADSGMIGSDALSPLEEVIIRLKDSEGKEFSLVKDVWIPLKDGTTAAVNTVIEAIDSSIETTANFLTFEAQKTAEIIIERIKSDTYLESLMGSVLADILLGENDPKEIAKHLAEGQLRSLATSLLDENIRKVLIDSGMTQSSIDNLVGPKVVNYVVNVDASGAKTVTALDASGKPVGATLQGTIYTAILNFAISAADSSGWNSEEYAQAAKVAIASAIVSAVVTTVLTAIAPGIGTVAGIVISAVVCALVVGPLVTYADDQYKITEDIFIMARDLVKDLAKDPVNTIEDFDPVDTTKQLIEYAKDYVENVGKFGRNVLIGGYNLFGGNYGKTYKLGQYPTPYPSVSITAKADGSGNIIQGLDPQGVTAIAREYYHDDIYGTSGSDNLIGKSGTNTIAGYEGNDHIEGRGDIDLLIGGAGDDEIFGGNGDDQLYGTEGNDNLFGGNGNDIIIGGTGASISGEGSLEDGNDFIQGGNGDDQIMGEAGNDQIQGNSGNDTILGGTGNDRIEGNEGDDSILGEDGDDMILGGVGSDIIDGGAGVDYIEGNEGNDNIRGGDGDDEIYGQAGVDIIYGDAGNDLINTGSENDLAFGGLGNDIIYGSDGDDTLSGELGNDYVIGANGVDTIDGGAGDDVLLGGADNDSIASGIGNDTIIFRSGDGQDTIDETDTITNYSINEVGDDTIYLSDLTSKLSDNSTKLVVLTKSGDDLVIQFKDDSGALTTDQITIKNQLSGDGEIVKKIERIIANDNFENILYAPRILTLNHR